MIKRLLGYLLLIAVALPASAAFDIGQLMGDLARHKGGKAKFVEKKYFAILDKPVVSTGEMTYTAPDRLEKRTLTPKVETLLLDKDILSIERDKQKLSINLANQPEALAFVDSIRGTLSGNRAALEKNYALHLAGNAELVTINVLAVLFITSRLLYIICYLADWAMLRSLVWAVGMVLIASFFFVSI